MFSNPDLLKLIFGKLTFDVEFDFVSHVLAIRHSDGGQKAVPLAAKPVAEGSAQQNQRGQRQQVSADRPLQPVDARAVQSEHR